MPVYHQMGHQSDNLVFLKNLKDFSGAIISPVNCDQNGVVKFIKKTRNNFKKFDIIFDPQLYYPKSQRGNIVDWSYFPCDVDTVDYSNIGWWQTLNKNLKTTVHAIKPNYICSPVTHPKNFSEDYYALMNSVSSDLYDNLLDTQTEVIQTVLLSLADLADFNQVMKFSSILTRSRINTFYLLFYRNINPRRELIDIDELKGAMLLIEILKANEIKVIVGYTNSEMLLWNYSGAFSCATGKHFNLRRFTPSRWQIQEGGGGQTPYIFEENVLGFLREGDYLRFYKKGMLSEKTKNNPYYDEIDENITNGSPWLGLSWRFYLYWFQNTEIEISNDSSIIIGIIQNANNNWLALKNQKFSLEETQNNGDWVKSWLTAISDYEKPW